MGGASCATTSGSFRSSMPNWRSAGGCISSSSSSLVCLPRRRQAGGCGRIASERGRTGRGRRRGRCPSWASWGGSSGTWAPIRGRAAARCPWSQSGRPSRRRTTTSWRRDKGGEGREGCGGEPIGPGSEDETRAQGNRMVRSAKLREEDRGCVGGRNAACLLRGRGLGCGRRKMKQIKSNARGDAHDKDARRPPGGWSAGMRGVTRLPPANCFVRGLVAPFLA